MAYPNLAEEHIGNYVELNSGGPTMRVESIDERGNAICSGRDSVNKAHVAPFPLCCLTRSKNELLGTIG